MIVRLIENGMRDRLQEHHSLQAPKLCISAICDQRLEMYQRCCLPLRQGWNSMASGIQARCVAIPSSTWTSWLKEGSQLAHQVQDFCVLFSLLLQHGMSVEAVAKSLARKEQPDGSIQYASISGMIVAELGKPPQWQEDS